MLRGTTILFKEAKDELRCCRYSLERIAEKPDTTRVEVIRAIFEWVDKLDEVLTATIEHLETLTFEVEELQKK
jgi:hypothetical protein